MQTNHATLAICVLCLASLAAGCGDALTKEQRAARSYLTKEHGPGEVVFLRWWLDVDSSTVDVPGYLAASAKEIEGHLGERGVALVRWAAQRASDRHLEKHLADGSEAKLVRVRIKATKLGREITLDRLVIIKGGEAVVDLPITELSGKEFREWIEKHFPSGS